MPFLLRLEITSSESPAWIPSPPKSLSPPQPSLLLGPVYFPPSFITVWRYSNDLKFGTFAVGPVVKNPPANAEDTGLIPGPGRFHMLQGKHPRAQALHQAKPLQQGGRALQWRVALTRCN